MYIGRTHPDTTAEDIKGVVKEYTSRDDAVAVELNIVEVINEVKDNRDRVISKSWRVTFPFEEKERMMQDSAWPDVWTWRQYFPPRKPKQQISLIKPGLTVNGINNK